MRTYHITLNYDTGEEVEVEIKSSSRNLNFLLHRAKAKISQSFWLGSDPKLSSYQLIEVI